MMEETKIIVEMLQTLSDGALTGFIYYLVTMAVTKIIGFICAGGGLYAIAQLICKTCITSQKLDNERYTNSN